MAQNGEISLLFACIRCVLRAAPAPVAAQGCWLPSRGINPTAEGAHPAARYQGYCMPLTPPPHGTAQGR